MSRIASSDRYRAHSSRTNHSARSNSNRPESVRDLLVPCHNLKVHPIVLKPPELRRVKTASRIITKQERQRQAELFEAVQCRMERECERRKEFLQNIDRMRDAKLGRNLDPFGHKEKAEREAILLDRVFLAKQEQEDEVKLANQIILAKKVYMVQDAQMREKRDYERRLQAEERRLENLVLERDAKALEEQKEQLKSEKHRREQYAIDLRKTLQMQELKKIMEAERIEDEAKLSALVQAAHKRSEDAQIQAKRERAERNRKAYQETIEMSEYCRKLADDEKREAEMKAQEFQRQRAEREQELAIEKRIQREQRQREIDRILLKQTQKLQTIERAETMAMRRIQEQKEREFREKTMEAAGKRIEGQHQLLQARAAQCEEMKLLKERQKQMDAVDRQRYSDLLKQSEEQEKAERQKSIAAKEKYRNDIIAQIQQRVQQDHATKNFGRLESNERQKQEELRRQNIRNVIASKIDEMRDAQIPENIVRDVERQLNLRIK